MEATNIYGILMMLKCLYPEDIFHANWPKWAARYNNRVSRMHSEFARYISAHYKLSDRDDSEFWRYVVNDMPAMKNLKFNKDDSHFPAYSWEALKSGMKSV